MLWRKLEPLLLTDGDHSSKANPGGSYIISVNAGIVADSGGTCVCDYPEDDPFCDNNIEYMLCVGEVKRDMITATAAISAFGTFFLGLLSNM